MWHPHEYEVQTVLDAIEQSDERGERVTVE